jgi:hypothetical protein
MGGIKTPEQRRATYLKMRARYGDQYFREACRRSRAKHGPAKATAEAMRRFLERWLPASIASTTPADVTTYRKALRADPCSYCGSTAGGIDHIEPRNDGGVDATTNLTAVCASCNSRKQTTPLLLFMLRERILHDIGDATLEQLRRIRASKHRDPHRHTVDLAPR